MVEQNSSALAQVLGNSANNSDSEKAKDLSGIRGGSIPRLESCPIGSWCVTLSLEQDNSKFYKNFCRGPNYLLCPELPDKYKTRNPEGAQ